MRGPQSKAGKRRNESDGHIQRLINAGVITPHPTRARIAAGTPSKSTSEPRLEPQHDMAGNAADADSQIALLRNSVYSPKSRDSIYSIMSGLESASTIVTTRLDTFSGPYIIMVSPFRSSPSVIEADGVHPITFSKEMLITTNHDTHHLAIDIFRPEAADDDVFTDIVFPLQDLSPLSLYRHLRSLSIAGMMQSYQFHIWLAVWLNPQLVELTLEMARPGESLDSQTIREAQCYAQSKPSMIEVVQGKQTATIFAKLPIVSLSLTNFVVASPPFEWFTGDKMRLLRLHRCSVADFRLPEDLMGKVRVTITG